MSSDVKHALKQNWGTAHVEEHVRELVRVMNCEHIGIRTIAACEGHLAKGGAPYIYFTCSLEIAAKIEILLSNIWEAGEGLNYSWTLIGRFNSQAILCFRLTSPELEHARNNILSQVYIYGVHRSLIDSDLMLLAARIGNLLNQLGNMLKIGLPYGDAQ